ncbi:WhiB family transcriptional regulator [Actinomadura luteofluorescens]|uniref:WhiB family transcriptional regulator n=1 Tax=Actinomadura luteofluorescens TaxID=46163 RepID=UPI0036358A50
MHNTGSMHNTENEEHWTDHAICRGADPDLFFPIGYAAPVLQAQEDAAKEICSNCPVRADCLAWALRVGSPMASGAGRPPRSGATCAGRPTPRHGGRCR